MSHILNHNRTPFVFKIDRSQCWDFFLDGGAYSSPYVSADGYADRCLAVSVDTAECGTVMPDMVYGSDRYVWSEARNGGLSLDNIGITGMDNGTILFDRNTVSSSEFNRLYGGSSLAIEEDDMRMHFRKAGGNNGIFYYGNDIVHEDGVDCIRLSGGFYQGFFKSGDGYQILPTNIGEGVCLEFVIKPDGAVKRADKLTMNDRYPSNSGIFFYIGTRAENKWYRYAEHEELFERISNTYFADDGYNVGGYFSDITTSAVYFDDSDEYSSDDGYFADGYGSDSCPEKPCLSVYGMGSVSLCSCKPRCTCSKYFSDGYFDKVSEPCECTSDYNLGGDYWDTSSVPLVPDTERSTLGGHSLSTPNIVEIETDNKFLMFDRTCSGVTADHWEEGTKAVITDVKADDRENYFLLYHRGCGGLLADKTWSSKGDRRYDAARDIYRNAFALQVRQDGSLGYKYAVKDCECTGDACGNPAILSEWTVPGVVPEGKWSVVHMKLMPSGIHYGTCTKSTSSSQKMRVMLYVDGRLKLVSKEIPTLNLRKLAETDDKQEGVPFNISLGGGTQGLADVVYYDYTKTPSEVLPIEREFGGSLFGYMRCFRFYVCPLSLSEIEGNVNFVKSGFET